MTVTVSELSVQARALSALSRETIRAVRSHSLTDASNLARTRELIGASKALIATLNARQLPDYRIEVTTPSMPVALLG